MAEIGRRNITVLIIIRVLGNIMFFLQTGCIAQSKCKMLLYGSLSFLNKLKPKTSLSGKWFCINSIEFKDVLDTLYESSLEYPIKM